MHKILLTERAIRDLEALESKVKNRIISTLKNCKADLIQHSRKLSSSEIGTYRFRIGVYRVIFDVHGSTAIILRIGHRKEIYR